MTRPRMPKAAYEEVMRRAQGACEVMVPGVCGGRAEHWHHRKLRSQGGRHEAANGLGICHGCHGWIHGHPARAYREGWLVRGVDEPGLVPVMYRGRHVLLADVGVTEVIPGIEHVDDIF